MNKFELNRRLRKFRYCLEEWWLICFDALQRSEEQEDKDAALRNEGALDVLRDVEYEFCKLFGL